MTFFDTTPSAVVHAAAHNSVPMSANSPATLATVNTVTNSYQLALTDNMCELEVNSGSASTIQIPSDTVLNSLSGSGFVLPIGMCFNIRQMGAGQVSIAVATGANGTGVTFVSPGSLFKTRVQYSTVSLYRRAANTWVLSGDLA